MQQKISSCVEPLLDEWSSSGDDVHANGEKISMILWKMKLMTLKTMVFMYLIFWTMESGGT
jgi:hypothetical protein